MNIISVTHSVPISIWTQSHSAGPLGPAVDGWRIGLHLLDGLPVALVPLLGAGFRPALVYSLLRSAGRHDPRIITELRVFVLRGWRGDMAAGLEWSEPMGTMMAWRRSPVIITATRVALPGAFIEDAT